MRFNLTLTFFALNNADRSSVYKSLVAFEPTSKEKKNLLKQFVYRVRQFHFSKWHWKEETPPPPPTPLNDAISPFSRKYLKAPKKNDSLETTLDEGRGGECGVEENYDVRDWIENKSTYASLSKQQFCLRLIEVYHSALFCSVEKAFDWEIGGQEW